MSDTNPTITSPEKPGSKTPATQAPEHDHCPYHQHSHRLYDMLDYNKKFVKEERFMEFRREALPSKRCVIITCMDTRLTHLLPHAINILDGDAKIIKNAGAVITHPFGGIMRSVMVALYELRADEVFVIGHKDCGMTYIDSVKTLTKMAESGISRHSLVTLQYAGIDVSSWLSGFASVEESVRNSVDIIRNHPLTPVQVAVHGLIIDPSTGELDLVVDGYKELPVLTGGIPLAHAEWLANLPSLPRTASVMGGHPKDSVLQRLESGMGPSQTLDQAIANLDIDSQDAILGALARARADSYAHCKGYASHTQQEDLSDDEERIVHKEVDEDSDDDSVVLANDVAATTNCSCCSATHKISKSVTPETLETNSKLASIIQNNDSRLDSLAEEIAKNRNDANADSDSKESSLSVPTHKIKKPSSGLMFNVGAC